MAFIRVEPVAGPGPDRLVQRRPREITWGDERLPVTRLAVVREEAAAYPVITGPRTLFEVETPRARLSLTYPAPLPPLDGDRPGRRTSAGAPPDRRSPHRPAPAVGALPPRAGDPSAARDGRAGTAPVPSPTSAGRVDARGRRRTAGPRERAPRPYNRRVDPSDRGRGSAT